uniref:DNA-directed RNA polymerase I subunit RPA34 n=1 Tax=Oryctolagus cuniculus TaxID=9986 RepID=G1TG19_RABIT
VPPTEGCSAARFSCPPNFTATPPAPEPPRFSLESLAGPDVEVWLIQAPADFAPASLNGRPVPLSGSGTVKGKLAGKRQRYRVLSSRGPRAGGATLLAPSAEAGGGLTCAPAPLGSLRILEGPQGWRPGAPLQPIPASPPPQVPPGLRPRFCAFGGSPPVPGPGAALALESPTSERRKKRRQKPAAPGTQEAVNGLGALEGDTASGRPETDARGPEAAEPAAAVSEALEPPLPSSSKRKKRKRLREEAPVEAEPLGPEEPGEAGPAEGAGAGPAMLDDPSPLPPRKRRKKEKRQSVEPEPEPCSLERWGEMAGAEGPPAEAALPSTRKKKKKRERGPDPGLGAVQPELPGDPGPEAAESAALGSPTEQQRPAPESGALETAPAGVAPPRGRERKRKRKLLDPGDSAQ